MNTANINRHQVRAQIAALLASDIPTDKQREGLRIWTPEFVSNSTEENLVRFVKSIQPLLGKLRQRDNPLTRALGDIPCWLLWRYGRPRKEGTKPPKVPLNASDLQPTDGATTVGKSPLSAVIENLNPPKISLGVTLGAYGDVQLSGFDIDNCIDEQGNLDARAEAILAACKGFACVEVSPSHRGLKGFLLGALHLRGTSGNVEVYDANRFFTVTGNTLASYGVLREPDFDELTGLQEALLAQEGVEKYNPQPSLGGDACAADDLDNIPIAAYAEPERVKKNILRFLNPAGMSYEQWINIGMALHHQFGGNEMGLDLWDEWSAQDEAGYPQRGRRELLTHYSSFAKTRPGKKRITLRTLLKSTEAARREATKAENRERCAHEEITLLVERLTADEVEGRFIYISGQDAVGDKENPRAVRSFGACRNHYAASKAAVGEDGAVTNAFSLWKGRAGRETVDTVTWHPGHPLVTRSPDGLAAFNTYQPYRPLPGKFVQQHADAFVRHIRFLFGDRAEDFLDWLAHIEQQPGILPHQAWLHVATQTGVGRNLIASALGRVWGSGVAQSFDLAGYLNGGFSGNLSQRTLVVVDELRESGAESHRHAQKLKEVITTERREINPKYGQQRVEFNCARWLMFSNFRSAIPLEHGDRRIEVVIYDGPPMSEDYYADLYAMLDDPDFIWSVKQVLATRDVSGFNPGARAKMTKHKLQAVMASRSDAATEIVEFTADYRWPLVTAEIVRRQLSAEIENRQFAKLMEDAGWVRLPGKHRTHLKATPIRLYVKREHYSEWADSGGNKSEGLPDKHEAAALMVTGDFEPFP